MIRQVEVLVADGKQAFFVRLGGYRQLGLRARSPLLMASVMTPG